MTMKEIEEQALQLLPEEREALAERLFASLEPAKLTEIEEAWAEESDRRFREYKAGRIQSRPGDDVFRDAYERFK